MPDHTANPNQPPLSHAEVDRRIKDLRRSLIPPRREQEDLNRPPDPDIRVDDKANRHTLTLVVDGVDVSWATVVDFEQQIGTSLLRMGGIASVGTHDDHRFRGYSRRVLENCLRWMKQHGYHTSMLYGIPSFYPKFGYAKAFPDIRYAVAVRDAEDADPGAITFVPFDTESHRDALLSMYRDNNRGRTGVTRRDPARWNGFTKGAQWNSRAIVDMALDPEGKAVGYVAFDDQHRGTTVIEVGYTTPAVFPALLNRAAQAAWRQRVEFIHFLLPEDDIFMDYCRAYGLRRELSCARDGGGMVRMIDVRGALTSVAEELASRMTGAGSLTLMTNLDSATLSWNRDGMTVGPPAADPPAIHLPQWALAQLLYGARSCTALLADGHIAGSDPALRDLDRMFPPRPHYQFAAEHF